MVDVFVLVPWDLNKLRSEVVYSILHLLKVLLYPFVFTVIVAINLTGDYLRVAIHDHICCSCHFGEIQSYYQGFVFRLVIVRREIESDHAFDLIPFWAMEYHTSSACLAIGRFVHVDAPLWALSCPLAFHEGEFYNEVNNNLSLYSHMWVILYVEFA